MSEARLEYLRAPREESPAPGSRMWCAARLGGLADVTAKYRFLTGSTEFDALLAHEMSPYLRYRRSGDSQSLVRALRRNAEALRINFPGYTSEVRYTDRVLRFPRLFEADGILGRRVSEIQSPNPALLYSTVTGDPGGPDYFPLNAVRWLTPPRDIATLITDSGPDRLTATLYHFGADRRSMGAKFFLLEPAAYTLTIAGPDATEREMLHTERLVVSGPRARVTFILPPRVTCMFQLRRE
jgi:hypothetical protein